MDTVEWLINREQKQETKMTRGEAINNLVDIASSINRVALVDALEALGLIKFDEPKQTVTIHEVINLARTTTLGTNSDQVDFMRVMELQGYKVVKI